MDTMKNTIIAYGELELDVQRKISGLLNEFCANCTECCCRVDICEEAEESLFLRMVRDEFEQEKHLSDQYGFLSETGCCLECGRPPVCYEFICDGIALSLDEPSREALTALCKLIDYIGQRAAGQLHLAEILSENDLEKIDCHKVLGRIRKAETVLEHVEQFLETGTLSAETRRLFHQIGNL